MKYTELNTTLVERFGELEQLCNQIYNAHHGVTNYIDEMESLSFRGNVVVSDWDYYFKRLKEVRHKRNQLSHGKISFNDQWADEDDICFVINFKSIIMNQTDPLSLLYKKSQPKKTPSIAQQTKTQPSYSDNPPRTNSSGCLAAILSFVFVVVCIIAFLL